MFESSEDTPLVAGLKSGGHRDARVIEGEEGLASLIAQITAPGDYVIFLGAGDVSNWANALEGQLLALDGSRRTARHYSNSLRANLLASGVA